MAPAEAALLDPQQRLLLQACMLAAPPGVLGGSLTSAASKDTGVFVGVGTGDYEIVSERHAVPLVSDR